LENEMTLQSALALSAADQLTDTELAQRILAQDAAAFELMMRRHNRLLYRTARSILRDDHEAEDCVQEAYLQAFRSIGSFRSESRLSTWLVRIVLNQAFERLRRHKREHGTVALDNVVHLEAHVEAANPNPGAAERPDMAASRSELRKLLENRIDRLPEAFRSVFILRALEELSVEETAECLGIPEATVRTRFFRARSQLREALARDVDLATEEAFGFDGERCDRIVANVLSRVSPEAPG
jgi:RNA polymerase sigma-70 factor (ECF subfamily)